jgi:hypothetical protein
MPVTLANESAPAVRPGRLVEVRRDDHFVVAGFDAAAGAGVFVVVAVAAASRRRTGTWTSDHRHSGSMNGPL